MRTALLVLIALATSGLSGAATAADIWKWVDANGVTHYSDQPVQGATKIEVRAGNISQSSSGAVSSSASPSTPSDEDAGPAYTDFEIYRPEVNESIINTGGEVGVEIRVNPSIKPLHQLSLYLDGQLVSGFPRNTLSYALTEVPRGVHSVTAVITDQYGKKLQETPAVGFNVRQESIANPPVGPTLRQPTKPRPRGAANKVLTTQPSYGALNGARPPVNPATNLPVAPKPAPKPRKP
jgi:hypothetical protein